jgi:hypothetical protein
LLKLDGTGAYYMRMEGMGKGKILPVVAENETLTLFVQDAGEASTLAFLSIKRT